MSKTCDDAPVPAGDLHGVVEALIAGYREDPRGHHINKRFTPSRQEITEIIDLLLQIFYPGYHGRQDLSDEDLLYHVGTLVSTLQAKVERQIERCLCFQDEAVDANRIDIPKCRQRGRDVARAFVARLPEVRRRLLLDVQAAYDGDPAAASMDEIILAYPGLLAVTVHRVAHELYLLGVPLMPRIMSEWAHTRTGADIHPGANIGDSFFIDHATGVVVGETTDIGAHVKLYQGVTLGALSLPQHSRGARGLKRHPTVEDDVTIYANATVLGGKTVLGQGSVVGGSVFLTKSVAGGQRVAIEAPRLRVASPSQMPAVVGGSEIDAAVLDFDI
ncbi:serine O-acetyltransferase [Sorangium cellulosum]|uniref:Serine acetyltransferase n=1 Tax=Sorangium cellulosum TaxID=56 RepID=A0A150QE96_SORCE|nr:serine O-acetyltransferase [Sorangium cellulosum]KYF66314.1 serine acetyltransferase [Sorangium cellulosum]